MSREQSTRRVLALMPHPDDVEILCAGTLIRLAEAGCEVHVATMTPGDKGSPDRPGDEIAAIRREEAQRGAEVIGAASCVCLEFRDVEVCFDNASRRRVAGYLRTIDPLLVITTPPDDYMFDHVVTSMLVRDACFNAPMPNYQSEVEAAPASGVPYLYYTDTVGATDIYGAPTPTGTLVDISRVIDGKCRALACHESQRAWLKKQHGLDDYVEAMKRWNARRGAEAGMEYAEAFRQHRGHPHPADDVLVELLGGGS